MTGVPVAGTQRHTRTPHNDRVRGWSDVSLSQGKPRTAEDRQPHQKLRVGVEQSLPRSLQKGPALLAP